MGLPREFEYEWSWTLPASPEALWPLVSDTNRFNRDVGLPPVQEQPTSDGRIATNARRQLHLRVKGVTLEWEELPFEWVKPWRFGVVRRYSRGPLREMRVLATLEEAGPHRTHLTYRVHARPRGIFGLVTTPIQIGVISRATFGRTFKRYAEQVVGQSDAQDAPEALPRRRLPRLRRAGKRLAETGVRPELTEQILRYVATADEMSLARIRPYERADAWGTERRETLHTCMQATRAGLLDLTWDVICPRCLGAKDRVTSLARMREGSTHCESCDVTFSRDFANSVEVSFRPTAAIRPVHAPEFCVAGPQITPHIEVQQLLAPSERRAVHGVLEPGRHRLRAWGVPGGPAFEVSTEGVEHVTVKLLPSGWGEVHSAVHPRAQVTLHNETDSEVLVDIERIAWADTAATAAEVTALADFRDIFSDEVLRSGTFMNVGSLAILFTDLKDSTRMYRRVGDAPAYRRVMRHFEVLDEAVREHEGAVVKTIGDAVMAVFQEPQHAMEAVRTAQARLASGTEMRRPDSEIPDKELPLVLKAGVHYGPCIAVTLNDRLDYFGSTVNIAARLGSVSAGNDVVLSDAVRVDPGVDELCFRLGAELQSLEVNVRGLEEHLRVWRVTFHDAAPEIRG
ncbi:MAG: adenylate/guanylate cyclase domain-containing protein [Gemmatimonadota bacterium]|nr:adenylate/guanylate cyclase domain-containing protein [Gemmatimonadota bacterium]